MTACFEAELLGLGYAVQAANSWPGIVIAAGLDQRLLWAV